MNEEQTDGTLTSVLAIIRRRWWIILGVVAICVAVLLYHQATRTKQYKATADVTFDSSSLSATALQADTVTTDPTRDGPTNVLVAESLQVATAVKASLGTSATAQQLQNDVSAQVAPNANVLQITATAGNPQHAATLANEFARQYINFETASQIKAINSAQADLQRQLAALPAGSPGRGAIQASIQRLAQLRAVADGGSQIISAATPPTKPSGASTRTIAVVAVLIGLAIAFTLILLLESLDRKITSSEVFQRGYGLPLLATIPSGFGRGLAADRDGQLEPFRILRTAIDLSGRAVHTLLVTSSVTGEGKTAVAVDLAHAEALTGRPVTLVELDLRRPSFSRHFSLEPRRGFTSVIAGEASLDAALVAPLPSVPNLRVLPSGPLPPNPAELLQSPRTSELLEALIEPDGLLIIDSPPLSPVADAQILLSNPLVDAAIVIARVAHTKRDDVRRARAILDRELVQPLGLVVTAVTDSGRYGYRYEALPSSGRRAERMRRRPGDRAGRADGASRSDDEVDEIRLGQRANTEPEEAVTTRGSDSEPPSRLN
jgi:polysaccharide biosynthesis transport protein